jgi:sugar lactone lactonase YvrE
MNSASLGSSRFFAVSAQLSTYGSRARVHFRAACWLAVLVLLNGTFLEAQTAHFSGGMALVGSGFSEPLHLAVDANGNLFVSDAENIAIYEVVAVNGAIPPSPTIRTLYRPPANPEGIAVDAQGNVYFSTLDVNSNLGNNSVTELVAVNGVVPSSPVVRQLGSGLEYPEGLAVDQFGDVFVSDSDHSLVKELVAVNGSVPASPLILTLGSGFNDPRGIAVDRIGNVYVSDFGSKQVKKILAVNGSIPASPTIVTLAGGFCGQSDIAFDNAGDLFVADYCNAAIFELPATNGVIQPATAPVEVASKLNGIEGVAVNSSGTLYAGIVSNAIPAITPSASSFGSVNLGSASSTLPQTFVFDSSGALGPVSVVTMGAPGIDFTNAGSSTCMANTTYATGQSCTVNVTFTPKFAGARNGAVELNDTNGNVIATAYLRGTGVGPQLNFSPGTQTTLGSSFDFATGVAVDGSGNAYVVDTINNLGNVQEIMAVNGEIPANPTIKTLVGGLDCPKGPALDASGDVYFVDACSHTVNEIQVVNGSLPPSPTVRTLTNQIVLPAGIAVDGSGNVYVLDASSNTVKEIYAVNGSIPASPTFATLASGFKELDGIAVDGNGNIYVSDDTSREVFEIHAVNGSIPASPLVTSLASGFVIPRGIAVDAAGNVYVAEYFYDTVYKLLAVNGSIPASPTIQTIGAGLVYASGVAVDGNRNVIVGDYGDARLVRLDYADPPDLTFASTPVSLTSTDSPQTVTLENVGNADLSFPIPATGNSPSITTNFTVSDNAPNTCPLMNSSSSGPGTLAAGASCALSINFAPTATGSLSGSLVLTDSNFNAPAPGYTSQSISLGGTGTQLTPTITWPAPSSIVYGTALTSTQLDATAIVPGTFVYSPATGTLLKSGTYSLTVTFTPTDMTDYNTATATVQLTVNKSTPTITWPTPSSITAGTPLSSTQLDAMASVPGTFAYSPSAGTVLATGSQTLTTVFSPTDSADYNTATASVILTVTAVPRFTLSASPNSLTVARGKSGIVTITVVGQNGFNSSVSLSASGLPKGVTAAFGPNPATGSSQLTFQVSQSAKSGTYPVTVKGVSDSLSSSATISLTVK